MLYKKKLVFVEKKSLKYYERHTFFSRLIISIVIYCSVYKFKFATLSSISIQVLYFSCLQVC